MTRIGAEDLRRLLREAAGDADGEVDPGEFEDTEFHTLGYDSLALMETAAKITDEYGVKIPDDRLFGLGTPRELLDLVNGAVPEPQ
jgi:minimal PKS acyl carrier protein